jgi:hypothetical protein
MNRPDYISMALCFLLGIAVGISIFAGRAELAYQERDKVYQQMEELYQETKYYFDSYYTDIGDKATPEEAVRFLTYARGTHQAYVEHPEDIYWEGRVEDEKRIVRIYTAIIRLIKEELE